MKGSHEIVGKPKPMRDFFSFQIIKTSQSAFFQEIQMPADSSFRNKKFVFRKNDLLKAEMNGFLRIRPQRMKLTDMMK